MPLTADPNDTIPYVLTTDRAKPNPPTFNIRATTSGENRLIRRLIKQANELLKADDEEKAEEALDEAIGVGLAGTVGVKFRGENVADSVKPHTYLTSDELWELATAVLTEPQLDEQKKRASASSAESSTASTANDATAPA